MRNRAVRVAHERMMRLAPYDPARDETDVVLACEEKARIAMALYDRLQPEQRDELEQRVSLVGQFPDTGEFVLLVLDGGAK